MKIARRWATTLTAAAILWACSDDTVLPQSSDVMRFSPSIALSSASRTGTDSSAKSHTSVERIWGTDSLYLHTIVTNREQEPDSRGIPTEQMSDYGSFGVFAYVYNGSWTSAAETSQPDYMYNVRVIQNGDEWAPASEYLWPLAECNIRFYAYAPYNCNGCELPAISMVGEPELRYEVPSTVASQKDLLVASTSDIRGGAHHDPANLVFRHALTAVRFVSGDGMLPGIIKRITIRGVKNSGTYSWASDSWTVNDMCSEYTVTLNKKMDETPDAEITPEASTLMMIPQILSDDAEIEIAFADDISGVTHLLHASIAGSQWVQGRMVEYRISTSSVIITPYFTVSQPAEFNYLGGKKTYSVDSRLDVVAADEQPLRNLPQKWTTLFSTDEGVTWSDNRPDWLETFTCSGNGNSSITPARLTAAVKPQTGTIHNIHNIRLRSTEPLTTTYDLSTAGGTESMTTANCYIVNAPGTYSLPLVYGNAIKNGSTNSSAYKSSNTSTSTSLMKTFVNHLGNGITDPYIYNNSGCTPNDAVLVWQDGVSQINDVHLSSDKRHLLFTVNPENIMQGNAIVAVRNSSKSIIWSWHIWVTDYKLGDNLDKITNFQGKTFELLPYSIGWCDKENINYDKRTVKIKFIQTSTKKESIITITQTSKQLSNCSNQTYFQWGRKDPMLGGNVIIGNDDMTDKQCYSDYEEYTYTSLSNTRASVSETIKNPHKQYCSASNWCTTYYRNLWNSDNMLQTANGDKVVKTIYDPSPRGYCVPPPQTFTGFTTNGNNVSRADLINSKGDYDWGWNFLCNAVQPLGATTYFAASGYRALSSGAIKALGVRGYAWTAGPIDGTFAWSLFYTASSVSPKYTEFEKAYSFPVRPCKE